MFVELSLHESDQRRRKRDAAGPMCAPNERSCCLQPLQIDFERFGWNWIAVPKRYNANFCGGECRLRHGQRYQHTHLVQQAVPGSPCCHGTMYGPLQIIYYNSNNELVVTQVRDMVVLKCGCA